jgi:hypothetical protein
MRVLVAALADHASVSQPGDKLNVNGVFDTIYAAAFPTVLPAAALALRLQLDYEDRGSKHSVEVVIVNQDGKEFAKLQGGIEAPDIPPGQRVVVNQIIYFQQLAFQAQDKFSIVIKWNGDEKQRLPLDVLAIQATPPGGG